MQNYNIILGITVTDITATWCMNLYISSPGQWPSRLFSILDNFHPIIFLSNSCDSEIFHTCYEVLAILMLDLKSVHGKDQKLLQDMRAMSKDQRSFARTAKWTKSDQTKPEKWLKTTKFAQQTFSCLQPIKSYGSNQLV